MSEWKEYKLGEIIHIVGGGTPKTSIPEYWNGNIPWLSVNDFNNGKKYVYAAEKQITQLGLDNSSTKILHKDDIIISARGTVGVVAMIGCDMAFNQSCYGIRNKDFVDKHYLYYLIIKSVHELQQNSYGGVFDTITRETFNLIDVSLPPLTTQRRIASILSSLDDKIDLLNRENTTLEAMAETLFRQWFIEEAKEDWEEVLITELFEVKDGTHDTPKPQSYGHKLITSKYIHDNSLDFNGAYNISDIDFYNINKRSKVETNDILFSMIGTIGLLYLEQNEKVDYAIKNVGLIKTSQNPQWKYYVYLWLKSELGFEWIHENKKGSTQEYISLNSLRNIRFKIKDYKQIQEFNQLVNDSFTKYKTNKQQIQTLIHTRDGLLPKLMSNEIKI